MQKLDNPPKNFLEFTPKCIIVGVEGGVADFFLGVQSYSFGNSGPHAKIQNPRTTPSGRKVRAERKKEERGGKNRGHYVCHAARLQCHTGSTLTTPINSRQ